jgi:hypothetical protein
MIRYLIDARLGPERAHVQAWQTRAASLSHRKRSPFFLFSLLFSHESCYPHQQILGSRCSIHQQLLFRWEEEESRIKKRLES